MNSLITGISGFVGGHLACELTNRGASVAGVDRSEGTHPGPARTFSCDILDFPCLERIVGEFRPQQVYHLAGLTRPSESRIRPRDYYLVNVQGTINLLEAVRRQVPDARVLVVSSAEVYGCAAASDLLQETAPADPANPYGASKLLAEMVGVRYFRDFGCHVVVARAFNHSGPGQAPTFVISDFCRQIAILEREHEAGRIERPRMEVGNLSSVRDFLDVRDVVKAYAGLVERAEDGEVYNVASGSGVSVQSILDRLLTLARVQIEVVVSPERYRAGVNERLVGSAGKLHRLLDWAPEYPLDGTLSDTLNYWRDQLK